VTAPAETASVAPAQAPAETAAVVAEPAATPAAEPAATQADVPAATPDAVASEAATPEAAPAPTETAAETATAEATAPTDVQEAPAASAVAAEPAAETAPEVAGDAPVAAAADPAPAEEAAPEAEVAAAPALAAPDGTLRENQISFAAWDIELPFVEDNRVIAGQRTAIVRGILPGVDIAEAGTWLQPGLLIYSVNGTDVQLSGSIATAILNSMRVDPDGMARVVVEYAGSSLEREAGLLTVPVTRLVSLGNGLNAEIRTVDGRWQTIVTGITVPAATTLRQGDVLYRDKTTGIALDAPDALEKIMASLVADGVGVTSLSVLRDNRIQDAAMQLAAD
jgi:hypothetical protein